MKDSEYLYIKNNGETIKQIREHTEQFLINSGRKSVILGVSGGVDSALVAALIRPVCDKIGIPLIGFSLPSSTNDQDEIVRAALVGKAFCHEFKELPIGDNYSELKNCLIDPKLSNVCLNEETITKRNIRLGNIKARIRMIYLFNFAQFCDGLVLSTDNFTEYLLGFWTLHGDVGNFGMIQHLWKTEVYNISEFLCDNELYELQKSALRCCILCNATDGLGISNSDLDQILPDWTKRHTTTRSGYGEVDDCLLEYITNGNIIPGLESVIERHTRSEFKRNDPTNITRLNLLKHE